MDEPKRILHVFGEMSLGGAETMIMNIYRSINRSKIQFDFVVHTQKKCFFDDEIERLGGKIYRVPKYRGRNHFPYKYAWRSLLKAHPEYKIIHGHVRSTASIYLKIANEFGLVTISHSHSTSDGSGLAAVIKKIFQHSIKKEAEYFLGCSKTAGMWLFSEEIVKTNKFSVLKNSIEVDKFTYDKNERNMIRDQLEIRNKFVVGHVGRFHQSKNHDFLIDIFKIINDEIKDSVLVLVGEGPLMEATSLKIKENKLEENVKFTGVRSDIPKLLQGMDVFIFPSIYEGLPVTLIEAQAAGLKIFASDVITDEVAITDNINFISLEKSAKYWAGNIISKSKDYVRQDMSEEIISAGYDIKENADWLQDFYLEEYKKIK